MDYRSNGGGNSGARHQRQTSGQHARRPSRDAVAVMSNSPTSTSNNQPQRPGMPTSPQNVSFQEPQRPGWRSHTSRASSSNPTGGHYSYSKEEPKSPGTPAGDLETGYVVPFSEATNDFRRKKSMVRPDREKIEPGHRQWHYRNHAAGIDESDVDPNAYGPATAMPIAPSTTGNMPHTGLRRGKSLLARDEDVNESRLAMFTRGATLRRKRQANAASAATSGNSASGPAKRGLFANIAPGPIDAWMIYCWLLTCLIPSFMLRACGMRTPERQRAWREKMGLMSIILVFMAGVGFLTFGFNQTVCGTPPNRYLAGTVDNASIIMHGHAYDFSRFKHPKVQGSFSGDSNPLYDGGWGVAGQDLSFMFQYDRGSCRNIITQNASYITQTDGLLDWMFPCNPHNQFGTSPVNLTMYDNSTNCHMHSGTQTLVEKYNPSGQVYWSWDNVTADGRNLVVYESVVLDLNLLNWLQPGTVNFPAIFNDFKTPNGTYNKRDVTMWVYRSGHKDLFSCLKDTITVGFIDTKTIGCIASQVVLYLSLIFIIGVVGIRFAMAVIFGWFVSYRIGAFDGETYSQRMARMAEIENWTDNIYQPAPSRFRPSVAVSPAKGGKRSTFLPKTSRFSTAFGRPSTTYGMPEAPYRRTQTSSSYGSKGLLSPTGDAKMSRSSTSLPSFMGRNGAVCPFPLHTVVPQPPPDYEPFNFPLIHTICLVTAYSESLEGLRTTLDSLATTDYPNSHKLIMVIADGMVKGHGNTKTTPEIILGMMKELIVPADEVEANSYVAIADGHKRHNMAKVYAGFYDYDDGTVEPSKQQRVPIVLVAKIGNPLEQNDSKPGNRGKRDSQMVLMAFLQKVMFDERMTTMEYEFFNSIWRVTGVSPDRYETILCVDADTKVFPDSLTRMTACMVHDEDIMGLCGETKIANKAETWVTMIQVFEYYISHHLAKAFESMFGGVTCLPGCFSMYRIKSPKGQSGYWVPILANPDVVEHYSENIVDTLHKKNLLLLGEDRYLTTLMLKTFPKRKMIFCPQAVCKTVVPDTFSVLLSQRRRWINSTVHNLAELLLVRDLCGTFCFSMQFVVGMELIGTLVLPAAIAFTVYLIVSSAIPGGPNNTISLVLLAIILGLPGLLIVITSRKVAYVGWMLVYLISLPIWNLVLPAYAYWHFDDFSWGQTRRISNEAKEGGHGDKEGEFDSSHIVMKRWAEFERERRWKNGMNSRDSGYDVVYRNGSPKSRNDQRYSLTSTSETFTDNQSGSRHSGQPMLLPSPRETGSPSGSSGGFDDDLEPVVSHHYLSQQAPTPDSAIHVRAGPGNTYTSQSAQMHQAQSAVSYDSQYGNMGAAGLPRPGQGLPRPKRQSQASSTLPAPSRGFTLTDPGFVQPASSESVRRVARQSKRQSSLPPASGAPSGSAASTRSPSRGASTSPLPPGAAPPRSSTSSNLPHGAAPPLWYERQ